MSSNSASDCIETTRHRDRNGYGVFQLDGRKVRAHRVAMAELHGWEALEGKVVMHLCDNPACINVDHLRIGTQADNVADRDQKGRWANGGDRKTHCKRGHELAGENLLNSPKGFRVCRECARQRWYLRRYGWYQPELPLGLG